MYIIGVILLFILPFAAGSICKGILRWKETNQIETYLIGFFFLFFLQGVIFVPCVFLKLPFSLAANLILGIMAALFGVGTAIVLMNQKRIEQTVNTEEKKRLPWRKGDKFLFAIMLIVFGLLVVRIVLGLDILRDDITLETVNTTLKTSTMYEYHPLTGMKMDGGMIASKKIVTLPLFYAALSHVLGLDAKIVLYLIVNILVLICAYYASALLFTKVANAARTKLYVYWTIYGMLILAGDYQDTTLAYRLLYQGYEGITICFGVLIPYLLYIILSWYKEESEEEKTTLGTRVMFLLKIALVFATSMVITGLGTGLLFLIISAGIAGVCCLLKSIQEVRACKE